VSPRTSLTASNDNNDNDDINNNNNNNSNSNRVGTTTTATTTSNPTIIKSSSTLPLPLIVHSADEFFLLLSFAFDAACRCLRHSLKGSVNNSFIRPKCIGLQLR
jgi:hypothetical protein